MINFDKLLEIGRTIEPDFTLMDADKEYYTKLADYFANMREDSPGLYIAGPVGSGKTLSMKIMQLVYGNFMIIPARHIIRDFMQSSKAGMDVIDKYGRYSFKQDSNGGRDMRKPIHLCIDDLGLDEVNSKLYGNQSNVMMEILLDRYDLWVDYGVRTYITSNATSAKIEENYGSRVKDRLKEMTCYIKMVCESKR